MIATGRQEAEGSPTRRWRESAAAGALAVAVIITCVLALSGRPFLLPALIGAIVTALAALIRPRTEDRRAAEMARSQETARAGIQALMSGIADPVVVLD